MDNTQPPQTGKLAHPAPRKLVLDIPFEYRKFASDAGAVWDKENKVSFIQLGAGESLPLPLTGFEVKPLTLEDSIQRDFDNQSFTQIKPQKKIVLRPHQIEAVRYMEAAFTADSPGFLLADDVGLGKTIETWAAILRMLSKFKRKAKILIVSPLGVTTAWRDTIHWMGTGDHIENLIVINYDRLGKLFEAKPRRGTKRVTKRDLAHRGEAIEEFDIVVFDESHYLKNLTASRTKFAIELYQSARFLLWLSATAGQDPLELGYTFPILAKQTGSKAISTKDFEQWCVKSFTGISRGKYGAWLWSGSQKDERKVHKLLFDENVEGYRTAIRRRPADIDGWPEINRIVQSVELDHAQLNAYKQAWEQFKVIMRQLDTQVPKQKATLIKNEAVVRLRQKSSILKVHQTVELTLELLDNGRQVAISAEFLATLNLIQEMLLKEKIPAACINGQLPASEKEAQRLKYQRGDAKVIVFSICEGISLHQGEDNNGGNNIPRAQIDHDLRWSAIQVHQIDGRSHRNGRFAQVYWMVAKGTIDERVASVLLRKLESMANLQGDSTNDFDEILLQIQ